MQSPLEGILKWSGVNRNVAKIPLPAEYLQVDHGSDRYKPGSWRKRRGMRHTSLAKYSSAVTTLLGLDLPGVDYAVMVAEGSNVHGNTNVTEQAEGEAEGFGEALFGEGGFGE